MPLILSDPEVPRLTTTVVSVTPRPMLSDLVVMTEPTPVLQTYPAAAPLVDAVGDDVPIDIMVPVNPDLTIPGVMEPAYADTTPDVPTLDGREPDGSVVLGPRDTPAAEPVDYPTNFDFPELGTPELDQPDAEPPAITDTAPAVDTLATATPTIDSSPKETTMADTEVQTTPADTTGLTADTTGLGFDQEQWDLMAEDEEANAWAESGGMSLLALDTPAPDLSDPLSCEKGSTAKKIGGDWTCVYDATGSADVTVKPKSSWLPWAILIGIGYLIVRGK